jgi:RND superfamily putative drug exporter
MDYGSWVQSHKKAILAAWIIGILIATPAILNYQHFINYNIQSGSQSNSESERALKLIAAPSNSTLIVVIYGNSTSPQVLNKTLDLIEVIKTSNLPYFSSISSLPTSYASFINVTLGNYSATIKGFYWNLSSWSSRIYSVPNAIVGNWSENDFSKHYITYSLNHSQEGSYAYLIYSYLNRSVNDTVPAQDAAELVQRAVEAVAPRYFGVNEYVAICLKYLNATNYSNPESLINATSSAFQAAGIRLPPALVEAVVKGGNPGFNLIREGKASEIPKFLLQRFSSNSSNVSLVFIYLNVSDDYRGSNGLYPAQLLTPTLRHMVSSIFGSEAQVTGNGAVSYDLQRATSSSGPLFAALFIVLAVTVGITLRSFISPLLALVFSSIGTLLGYVAIFATGVLIKRVDYVVTYTLNAAILGVAVDYLVFILSLYKENLRKGMNRTEALVNATNRGSKVVVVSSLTIALALASLSLVPSLRSWGPVLLIAVLLTAFSEISLLPSILGVLGNRVFRGVRKKEEGRNPFYRAAEFSSTRRWPVLLVFLVIASASIYFWFHLPTTYNFNQGLPKSLESVQALNSLQSAFGYSALYPSYVIVNLTQGTQVIGGNLTSQGLSYLKGVLSFLTSLHGVSKVIGPVDNKGNFYPQFLVNSERNAYFTVYYNYSPYSQDAIALTKELRGNSSFIVGGLTSSIIDQQEALGRAYAEVEVAIALVILAVLGIGLRDLRYSIASLSGVFISVTVSSFLSYLVFKTIFHLDLIYLIPVILYVILMSLGNDFSTFVLSRVKEALEQERSVDSMSEAFSLSGNVVSSLGIILAFSLGSLSLLPIAFLRELGVVFIISLLLDTFVIRPIYFPALLSALFRVPKEKVNTDLAEQS